MEFFGQLLASMGPNIEFKIRLVSGGNDFTTGVIWHLGTFHLYCLRGFVSNMWGI